MSVKNRERQIFEPRISRTYIIIYSDVPWVFLDHLENYTYIFNTTYLLQQSTVLVQNNFWLVDFKCNPKSFLRSE